MPVLAPTPLFGLRVLEQILLAPPQDGGRWAVGEGAHQTLEKNLASFEE